MSESRITDGATLRHSRILGMLKMINDSEGATSLDIQSFMLAKFGLKHKTTIDYIRECWLSGFIVEDHGKWIVTQKFKRSPFI